MATGFYAVDNPNPYYRQYGTIRRDGNVPCGLLEAHSTESVPDWVGPDTGAETVARWIATIRTNAGSYHVITDSDSGIRMVPVLYEAWGDVYTNKWATHYSMATQASKWHLATPEWRFATIGRTARMMAEDAKWFKNERNIIVPARLLTKYEAHTKKPGIIFHGLSDTARRTDPWVGHPNAGAYTDFLIDTFASATQGGSAPTAPTLPPVIKPPSTPGVNYNPLNLKPARVKQIQTALKGMGYYKGNIDGEYGRWTYNAVKAYQDVQIYWPGKVADGIWGPRTDAHYNWVKELQSVLNGWRGYAVRIDGDYGPVTRERVRYTQGRNGLWTDGMAGPKTCLLLNFRLHP